MTTQEPRRLELLIGGVAAGIVEQRETGELTFFYHDGYEGCPLSLNMPVSNQVYGDKLVRPYLLGLLPDDVRVLRALGRSFDVSGGNPFALLSAIGLDCPGAVQLCPPDRVEEAMRRSQDYREITPDEIAARLLRVEGHVASWQAADEHWSLGGQQTKIALARFGEAWYACEGAAATTHIIKPGIARLHYQALNEHFCLRLAQRCGISASRSEYVMFGEVPAIVVERYDRVIRATHRVQRLHQEDFCQALGVVPIKKYASEGGPSARDVADALRAHPRAEENLVEFTAQLFFNYLVGAPDAHAKNYSVLISGEGVPRLAPLYDVASGLVYELEGGGEWRAAMSIGGQNRFGRVRRSNVQRYAESAHIDPEIAVNLMGNLAESILRELPAVAREIAAWEGGEELGQRLAVEIGALCQRTISML